VLRGDASLRGRALGLALAAVVGAGAAALVALGNPGNMGICGACFARDAAGALGLQTAGPAILRPEFAAVVLGAFVWSLAARRGIGRAGGYAGARFVLCLFMAIGALVFLGCPFRLLQRLGGGDPTAWLALPGFVAGVRGAMFLEHRGPTVGKTQEAPWIVGALAPLAACGLLALFLAGVLRGPGPGDAGKPPHAPWLAALAIALVAGGMLSATGFCAVSASRQVFRGPRWMLAGAGTLVAGYALVVVVTGAVPFGASPATHGDWAWNVLGIGLAGFTGALAGGCPVRQMVMAGEGNNDAFAGVAGLVAGGALAHNLGLASIPAAGTEAGGPTTAGKLAVVVGFVFAIGYGFFVTRRRS
jgi:YedE family putative selenium metabolism protein